MKKKYQIIVGILFFLITGCNSAKPEMTEPIIQNDVTLEGVDLIDDYMRVLKFYEQRDVLSTHRIAYLELKDHLGSIQTMEELKQFEDKLNAFAKELDDVYQMDEGTRVYRKGLLIVDRGHCLPPTYEPGPRYEAENQFLYMQAAALKEGVVLRKISSYHTHEFQNQLYEGNKERYGIERAHRYGGQDGCSEHRSGYGFDIGGDDIETWNEMAFVETQAYQWLQNNAYQFGFILRYPEGKEAETGYAFQPWHYRYVGAISEKIIKANMSLDAYLNQFPF
ncbi:D-alanyl-D-alanine carboxypeptidase family protein [Erysipelothrix sp. strain 2 (EsS2-7-Brazil)]|uniref:M15 family metallopeptidase n=1 Tax=Erysipelothrix sp. strain 2 (EsS2-7-Brazil) TaxID=2500579 RepID=UPI00190B42EA|nr:M15 family metallopeptidase [Erysipelothrix sp. strain 2 (EsS2-7-Brazil)]MBK2404306.1 D-alanyl-D-alanine carboxypeptidase family protein [Erysipelothrix sp. strain 2 (EsS2-7-Brazil)]